jgi:hypothetical protein
MLTLKIQTLLVDDTLAVGVSVNAGRRSGPSPIAGCVSAALISGVLCSCMPIDAERSAD